jgi:hypothetical protein
MPARDLPRRPPRCSSAAYVHASAGNISVRLPGDGGLPDHAHRRLPGLAATRQAGARGADGVQRGGDRASKTLALHRRIYACDAERAA